MSTNQNKITEFMNKQFGSIRTLVINDKPYFCASDIAKSLGYVKPYNAISTHCRATLKQGIVTKHGNMSEMIFIPEGDVYRLIIKSKLKSAEEFESWLMDEVLPQIRMTGGYIPIKESESNEEFLARAVLIANETLHKKDLIIQNQKKTIEQQKPCVDFARTVKYTNDLITVEQMAKILCDKENIRIGRNRLFDFLRLHKVFRPNNVPYQKYMDRGYFKVREKVFERNECKNVYTQTFITGIGQLWLTKFIIDNYA